MTVKWGISMAGIDFNRIMKDVKEEIEFGKVLFMSEEKRDEYYRNRQAQTERRFYDEGGPHNSNRQLYMMKMITTPLIQNNLMPYLQRTTEVGGSYQPEPNTPLVFVPEQNDHVSLYYKSHRVFDLEFKDEYGQTVENSGIKSYSIQDQHAKSILSRIPNEEWNQVVDKVVPEIMTDSKDNQESVMRNKCDTPYIHGLKDVIYKRQLESKDSSFKDQPAQTVENNLGFKDQPSSRDMVNSMTDEELNRMFEQYMESKVAKENATDHELEV